MYLGWPFNKISYKLFQTLNYYKAKNISPRTYTNLLLETFNNTKTGGRCYLIPYISFNEKQNTLLIYKERNDVSNEKIENNASILKIETDYKYLITESYIYLILYNINETTETITQFVNKIDVYLEYSNIHDEKYTKKLNYDSFKNVWVYK